MVLQSAGTLRAAAGVFNVTQPALSKSLSEMESAFGFPLFIRGARGLTATPQGAIAIRGAALLLEELSHMGAEASAHPVQTVLRIGAPPFVAQGYLPAVLVRLLDDNVRVQLEEERVPLLLASLLEGRLDALVTSYPADMPDMPDSAVQLKYENLFDAEYTVIAPPDHPLARARQISWRRLGTERWIMPGRTSMLRRALEDNFRHEGVPVPVPVIESLSPVTNMRLVAAGLGLCAVPLAILGDALANSQVKKLRVHPAIQPGPVALIYRATSFNPRLQLLRHALGLA